MSFSRGILTLFETSFCNTLMNYQPFLLIAKLAVMNWAYCVDDELAQTEEKPQGSKIQKVRIFIFFVFAAGISSSEILPLRSSQPAVT